MNVCLINKAEPKNEQKNIQTHEREEEKKKMQPRITKKKWTEGHEFLTEGIRSGCH